MSNEIQRPKRSNAGSKMARLLNDEEEDEFYTTIYGGFQEEHDDNSYRSESSESDQVDSDFDVDENQMQIHNSDSDANEDEPKRKKSRRVITKAYREPNKNQDKEVVKIKKVKSQVINSENEIIERKNLRHSTQIKTEAIQQREIEYKEKMLKEIAVRKNVPEVRRLTQDELLEEAKITEEINTRSLAQYQRLELEKKKARAQKAKIKVPMIKFNSVTVPLFDENCMDTEDAVVASEIKELGVPGETKCSRNFITFEDDGSFNAAFPVISSNFQINSATIKGNLPKPVDKICAITGERAKYFDPLTKTPYSNLAAFRVLRKLYSLHKSTGSKPIELVRKYRRGEINIGGTD